MSSIPGLVTKSSMPHDQEKKNEHKQQNQYCNKLNRDFKNGPHKKKIVKKTNLCAFKTRAYFITIGSRRNLDSITKYHLSTKFTLGLMVTNTQGLTNARLGLCFPSISVLNLCIFRESETHNLEASWRCAHPNHPGQEHPNTRTSCMHTKLTLSPSHLLILIRLLLKNIFLKIKWILFPIVSTFSYKETTPFFLIFETNLQKKKK